MLNVQQGQCGTCIHFGTEHEPGRPVTLPSDDRKALALVEPCQHPKHAVFELKVTPISACADFETEAN